MCTKSIASYNKAPCVIHLAISDALNNEICLKKIRQIIAKFAPLALTEYHKKNISIYCANLQQAKEVIDQIKTAGSNRYLKITPITTNNML